MTSRAEAVRLAAQAWTAVARTPVRLVDRGDLGGSTRSLVLRVAVEPMTGSSSLPASAVIKAFPMTDGDGEAAFAAEVTAAAFCGAGPRLLAHDPSTGVAVFSDLGSHLSLADLLLGSDPARARAGVLAWAGALGDLAAWSAGRAGEYAQTRAGLGLAPTGDRLAEHLTRSFDEGVAALEAFVGGSGRLVAGERADALAVLDAGPFAVFSPADACPDNNLVTPDGLLLLDYESAGFHSAFLDAVYCRMPFPTCWCAFELPGQVAAEAERAYRDRLVTAVPEAAEDAAWELGLLRAEVVWVIAQARWLLPRSLADNEHMGGSLGGPPRRTLLVHRWRHLAGSDVARQRFPAACALLDLAAAAAEVAWGAPPALGPYPAFRPTP